jgi:glycosyltransferase involved in cell wall biosynthesis
MMKVILDTSIVLGEGQSSYRYFSELIPRLRREPDVNLELIPSPYYELPGDWFPEKPSYQPLQTKARWLPQGRLRQFLSQAKRRVETYRQKKALYQNPEHTLFHSFYYTTPLDDSVRFVPMALDAVCEKIGSELNIQYSFKSQLKQKARAFERANRIISISQSTKNDVMDVYGIPSHKIDTIYLAVDTNFWIRSNHFSSSLDNPYLLQVGGRQHHRNFNRLLEAFVLGKLHKDYLLVCAGEAWEEEELELIQKLQLKGRVKLIRNPSNETLRSLYQQAKMLVYPSLYEGFGFPLIEAMACGTPVATSKNAGSISEVAGDAAHYFDPRDPADIAKKIEELLDPKLARSFIEKGFQNVKRFSWDKTAQETLNCYRKVFSA